MDIITWLLIRASCHVVRRINTLMLYKPVEIINILRYLSGSGGVVVNTSAFPHNHGLIHRGSIPSSGMCSVDIVVLFLR